MNVHASHSPFSIVSTPTPNNLDTAATAYLDPEATRNLQIQRSLTQVLKTNEDDICKVWLRRLLENWSSPILLVKLEHLQHILLPGFRDYISSTQNCLFLSNALNKLVEAFAEYLNKDDNDDQEGGGGGGEPKEPRHSIDTRKLLSKQVQNAIFYFQDAIDCILKIQNIPPHWIFALDSLIRSTVQTTLNMMYHHFNHVFLIEGMESANTDSSAGITNTLQFNRQNSSLTNIDSSHTTFDEDVVFNNNVPLREQFRLEMRQMIQENQKTVNALTEVFTEYVQEQNKFFKTLFDKVNSAKMNLSQEGDQHQNIATQSTSSEDKTVDQEMINFLKMNHLSQSTIETVRN